MSNRNPTKAREAKARKRLSATDLGDFTRLQAKLWALLGKIEEALADADQIDPQNVRVVYAFAQIASTFARIHEVGELEARISALEAKTLGGNTP